MIYMVKSNDLVKIGYTKNVSRRLLELQTGNPYKLNLVFMGIGGADEEKQLHEAFSKHRSLGEWFKIENEFERVYEIVKNDMLIQLGLIHDFKNIEPIPWEASRRWLVLTANDLWSAIETCWSWDGWGEKYYKMACPIQDKLDSIRDEDNPFQDIINAWQILIECQHKFRMIEKTIKQELGFI